MFQFVSYIFFCIYSNCQTFWNSDGLKAGLHNGAYCSKLVPYEAQKNIFYVKKGSSLEQFMPQSERNLKVHLHYGNYCSKLVHLESQKMFSMFKKALA
jgi:hypothetical protein